MQGDVAGLVNSDAAKESEVIVVTLPPRVTVPVLEEMRGYLSPEQIVVSTVVPMARRDGLFRFTQIPSEGVSEEGVSAAEVVQEIVKPVPVVAAFQTGPAAYLSNIDSILNVDVLIAGDDDLAITVVSKLVRDIPNLRPLRVGPLENSKWIESLTPLLLNAAILNGLHDPSIRVVPWMPTSYEI
jgi:NADPH-dependent F420 reductase